MADGGRLRTRKPPLVTSSLRQSSVISRQSSVVTPLGGQSSRLLEASHRQPPGIPRVQIVDDVELDAVRVDVFALLLRPGRLYDLAVFQLAAVRDALRHVFGFVRIDGPDLLGLF